MIIALYSICCWSETVDIAVAGTDIEAIINELKEKVNAYTEDDSFIEENIIFYSGSRVEVTKSVTYLVK